MLFNHLVHIKKSSLPSLKKAYVFCDSKLAINAATAQKPATNIALCTALKQVHMALSTVISVELHWIRGHSRVGGNERVDRISKRYASIDYNIGRFKFNGKFSAHISQSLWPFGGSLVGLPEAYFLLRLPSPPRFLFDSAGIVPCCILF